MTLKLLEIHYSQHFRLLFFIHTELWTFTADRTQKSDAKIGCSIELRLMTMAAKRSF